MKNNSQRLAGPILQHGIDLAINSDLNELGINYDSNPNSPIFQQLKYVLTNILQYPLIHLAEIHRDANKLGKRDLKIQQSAVQTTDTQYCEDCGFARQTEPLNIVQHSLSDLSNLGVSTYLFFRSFYKTAFLMFEGFILFSIFAFATNLKAAANDSSPQNSGTWFSYQITLGAKEQNLSDSVDTYYVVQSWLGVLLLIVWTVTIFIFKYIQADGEVQQTVDTKSAADYSLMLENIPIDISKDKFERELNSAFISFNHDTNNIDNNSDNHPTIPTFIKVVKLNFAQPFYQLQQNIKCEQYHIQKEELKIIRYKIIDIVLQLKQSDAFITPFSVRKEIYSQYAQSKGLLLQQQRQLLQNIKHSFDNRHHAQTATAFLTLQTNRIRDIVLQSLNPGLRAQFCAMLSCGCFTASNLTLTFGEQAYSVDIKRAPEPQDIVWSNFGFKTSGRVTRKLITFSVMILILGISFCVQFFIPKLKKTAASTIVILLSIALILFNIILGAAMSYITSYERDITVTNYQTSLTIKAIAAQLINSILIPILNRQNAFKQDGLTASVLTFAITNALLTPFLLFLNPGYLISKLVLYFKTLPYRRLGLSQAELNSKYEYSQMQTGYESIYILNTFLFSCFYMPLQPAVTIFAVIGAFLMYWAQKFTLFYRSKRPIPGTNLINIITSQIIAGGGLFYAIGNYFAAQIVSDGSPLSATAPNLLSLIIGIIMLFLPYDFLFIKYIQSRQEDEECSSFEANRIALPSQYDRLNPSTSEKAVREYLQYIQMKKRETESTQREVIQFTKQTKKHNRRAQQQQDELILRSVKAQNWQIIQKFNKLVSNQNPSLQLVNSLLSGRKIGNNINEQILDSNIIYQQLGLPLIPQDSLDYGSNVLRRSRKVGANVNALLGVF